MDNLDEKNQDGENVEDQVLPSVDDVPAPDVSNEDEDESVTGGETRAERRARARAENKK